MHSFDIFDTLITRSTAVPQGIFMLMEKKDVRDEWIHFISLYKFL